MAESKNPRPISTKLYEVMERAKRPEHTFLSLAHLIDEEALERAFHRLRRSSAAGADGLSREDYEQGLEANVRDLHERLRSQRWRHQPIRRVHIPKEGGRTRPIGISCVEDKLVQSSLRELLDAVYEPIFRDCSYGFRPGRGAHDAIRALNSVLFSEKVSYVLELDIESYFDSIDRKVLQEMLRERVNDRSLRRLIGKCLHVGVLEGADYSEPSEGTVQGSALSPVLGNIYLHHVLDLWFEHEVLPRLRGRAHLFRYADDGVMTFENEEDAARVLEVLPKRFGRFGLRLHPEKTRLVPFRRPSRGTHGKRPGTFEFLGFTHYWRRSRRGHWVPRLKTRKASVRRFVRSVSDQCRSQRHRPVQEQHAALKRKLVGFFNYFGVNGNVGSLRQVRRRVEEVWFKWLNRRSQRARKAWAQFEAMQCTMPLPRPRVCVPIWCTSP